MLNDSKKLLVTMLSASISCLALTACGGSGVDSKPNISNKSGSNNTADDNNNDNGGKDDNNDSNPLKKVTITALQGDVTVDKYEDGQFINYEIAPKQFLKYCQGVGESVDRCGLLTYTISGSINDLVEIAEDKPLTVDYQLVSDTGNIADILKDPSKTSGTIKLYRGNIQEKLYFELKSDNKENADWNVSLVLSNPTGGADISSVVSDNLKAVIKDAKKSVPDSNTNNSSAKINDTGVVYTGLTVGNEKSCTGKNQDCNVGRDIDVADNSDGQAGFSFTKISTDGTELTKDASNWECVKDNVTGLIWERKTYAEETDKKDYRDLSHSYVYYNANNGLGVENKQSDCQLDNCTTTSYIAKLNENKLCGIDNWRLPSKRELFDLANLNTAEAHKVLHSAWLHNIPMDYDSKPDNKIPSSLWTDSVAASYDRHDGYSSPYSLKFNHIWVMFPKGGLNRENPNSSYSSAGVLAVAMPK